MSNNGYVKVDRGITRSSIWCDSDKLKLWLLCIFKATHKARTMLVGNQKIDLVPGQFITGRNDIENEFNEGVKRSSKVNGLTLFRWLELFEKAEMLNIKKTNKYSLITIINWDEYQGNRTTDEQQMNNKRTSNEQQLNTNKNVKNVKNDKNDKKKNIPTHHHGEYKNVLLTENEMEKLITDYPNHQELIKFLDEYIEMKGYKAKSHYLAIKKWVVDAVKEKSKKKEVLPF